MSQADSVAVDATHPLKRLQADRRRAEGCTLTVAVRASLDGPQRRETVLLVNVGVDGIGFLARAAFAHGTPVTIDLPALEPASAGIRLAARVSDCTPQAAGEWYVGCVTGDEEILAHLYARLMKLGARDARIARRPADAAARPEAANRPDRAAE